MAIQGLLLDMDGTLLDIELGGFLKRYFAALGPVLAEVVGQGTDARDALGALMKATDEMCLPHDGTTNRDRFNEVFFALTGARLDDDAPTAAIDAFYRDVFPSLLTTETAHRGAAEVIEAARLAGMRIALATNPIFPRVAIVERLRWAGFAPEQFDLVTSYENMHACKPAPRYFRDVAAGIGVDPSACLMVGDDPVLDMSAADVGMKTFYVGPGDPPACDWSGDLNQLAELIERLT